MYTTHGYMTAGDYQEYLKDTDQHSIEIDLENPPEWFKVEGDCPVCSNPIAAHESLTIVAASSEPFECWFEGEHGTLSSVDYPYEP